jgi:methylated-DNA-[protein]-cysteine S-methyltransferase
MALVGSGSVLWQLTFGHQSPQAAVRALDAGLIAGAKHGTWNARLVGLLKAYAAGKRVDFSSVQVECGPLTEFQRRVLAACRAIPHGQTRTYGQLAASAGSPRAARAVGNVMAANRIPLVVPCHRVVPRSGGLGRYSAPGGVRTKLRLLETESA